MMGPIKTATFAACHGRADGITGASLFASFLLTKNSQIRHRIPHGFHMVLGWFWDFCGKHPVHLFPCAEVVGFWLHAAEKRRKMQRKEVAHRNRVKMRFANLRIAQAVPSQFEYVSCARFGIIEKCRC